MPQESAETGFPGCFLQSTQTLTAPVREYLSPDPEDQGCVLPKLVGRQEASSREGLHDTQVNALLRQARSSRNSLRNYAIFPAVKIGFSLFLVRFILKGLLSCPASFLRWISMLLPAPPASVPRRWQRGTHHRQQSQPGDSDGP